MTHDPINHPAHYDNSGGIQPVDALEVWAPFWPVKIIAHLSHALVYIARAGRKGDAVEDLRKAKWWIERAIGVLTKEPERKVFASSGPIIGVLDTTGIPPVKFDGFSEVDAGQSFDVVLKDPSDD